MGLAERSTGPFSFFPTLAVTGQAGIVGQENDVTD